tara:strand:- start:846 stop:1187 length:342 start_codon:yes stop_codon:yes gene_type:complete
MHSFFQTNKNLIIYALIFLVIIPFFGLNFFISFIGNILLLLFLIPLLLIIIAFISFNSLKSKLNICDQCGSINWGLGDTCMNCGINLNSFNNMKNEYNEPSESTIEIKAEEVN